MPLREAEREVLSSQANDDLLAQSSERERVGRNCPIDYGSGGTNRPLGGAWLVLSWYWRGESLNTKASYRLCRLITPHRAWQRLPFPALSKNSHARRLAGDLMGVKTTGAVFIKVLESRTIQDDLIVRFKLRRQYFNRYWEYMDDTRSRLSSRTTITEDKKSGVISVSVRDHNAELAADWPMLTLKN